MKKTSVILSLLFIISLTSISVAQDKEGFELIKKEDQISIFERWINYPNANSTTQAREVKGEFTIATNVYAALKLIRNEEKIQIWQTHVSEFKVYLQPDTMVWYEYSYHDIPWPVTDQDHYLKYKLNVIKPNEQLFVTFESAENKDLAPVREDVDRMGLTGSWRFEKLPGKMIKVTYRIISKPSSIPRLFTDPVIRRNIMSTIRSYIDILEGRK